MCVLHVRGAQPRGGADPEDHRVQRGAQIPVRGALISPYFANLRKMHQISIKSDEKLI